MSCLQKIIVIFGKKFKLLNTLLTIGRNYACGQWFVMYVNTETSLVNTVQVTKDIFNTSLVSKLSARPTSLHCLVSAGLSLLILMPALLQFRNTSSSPHLQSSANTALPSRLLQVSAQTSSLQKGLATLSHRCALSFPAPIHFLHSPSRIYIHYWFLLCVSTPNPLDVKLYEGRTGAGFAHQYLPGTVSDIEQVIRKQD